MSQPSALDIIREHDPEFKPLLAMILGSGLGGLSAQIADATTISYRLLPGFPQPSIEGHAGELVLGYLQGVPVVCLKGRVHLYEGGPAAQVALLVRTVHELGAKAIILTNAAGSLRPEVGPGMPCLISDHINFQGTNPLVGPNDPTIGPRFVDLTNVYDPKLRAIVKASADAQSIELSEGVYMAFLGPCFETPAEIHMAKAVGADLVGMSTVPEAIVARHCGMKVLAISAVTNLAAGMSGGALSHEETLREGGKAGERIGLILAHAMKGLADAVTGT